MFFGVGTTPVRARGAEAALIGRRADADGAGRGRPRPRRRPRPARRHPRLPGAAPASGPRAARSRREPAAWRATREDRADRQRRAGEPRASSRGRTWSTSSATTSGSRARTWAASTASAARAPCAWTARRVRGCLMLAAQADGCRVETIEGLAESGAIADLQHAFRAENALQCGFCTPGMLLTAHELLARRARSAIRRPSARPSAATTAAAPATTPSSRPSCARRSAAGARGRAGGPIMPSAAPTPAAPGNGSYIGRSVVRPQTARLVAGRGTYTDDVALPRLLHAAFVRSPHAHARIVAIDTAEAAALPGVVAVVTGREMAARCEPWVGVLKNYPGMKSAPQYPLALDKAVWQGEPVVAVVAEIARPRGGRLRARARDVGAAAARRGRRGRARARRDAHPSGARRQPRARVARRSRATWTRRSARPTPSTATPSTPGATRW